MPVDVVDLDARGEHHDHLFGLHLEPVLLPGVLVEEGLAPRALFDLPLQQLIQAVGAEGRAVLDDDVAIGLEVPTVEV